MIPKEAPFYKVIFKSFMDENIQSSTKKLFSKFMVLENKKEYRCKYDG